MNYIVMDLEWNQCPGGKEEEVAELPFEIFEIGAVKLNQDREIVGRFLRYIKPQVYKELHYIAKGLTHVSMELLKGGDSFSDVADAFFAWCGAADTYRVCTWGPSDLIELQRNMTYFGVKNPFGFPLYYYDVQKLFSISREDGKVRRALETAVDMQGIEKSADFHCAFSDAEYTAKIMQTIDFERVQQFFSIDTYRIPRNPKSEIDINYGTYSKYITMGYDDREELIKSPRLLSVRCYLCGRTARRRIRWFTVNSRTHYCLAECKEHGYIKAHFRVKEEDSGKFYAVRILKITDEEGAAGIRRRQQEVRKRRHEKQKKKASTPGRDV